MAKEVERLNIPQIDWNEFAEKGRAVYERVKDQLMPQYKGWFIAIDPETGDYALGKDPTEANHALRQRHPGKVFYLMRVGYRAAGRL
ncbi:MAG: hypothetical protein NZ805_04415 [Armatimonadetes bacterium]|nr:hypothetical protein [Armatimonadota bacterium]MDW8027955.1 hypothetical protein [Armatimonadota bacterium]